MNDEVESVLNTSLAEKNELTLHKEKVVLEGFKERVIERMKLPLEAAHAVFHTNDIDNLVALFLGRFSGFDLHLDNNHSFAPCHGCCCYHARMDKSARVS